MYKKILIPIITIILSTLIFLVFSYWYWPSLFFDIYFKILDIFLIFFATNREDAVQLIHDCKVKSGIIMHSGWIYLNLKDGSRIKVKEPMGILIQQEVWKASSKCGFIPFGIE